MLLDFIQKLVLFNKNIRVTSCPKKEMFPSLCKAKIIEGTQLFWAVATVEYQDEELANGDYESDVSEHDL